MPFEAPTGMVAKERRNHLLKKALAGATRHNRETDL